MSYFDHPARRAQNMETITLADYIQYGFLAFIGLLLVAMLVALLRQGRDIGELKGELRGTNRYRHVNESLRPLRSTASPIASKASTEPSV